MSNIREVLNRLKIALNAKSFTEVAEKLGVSESTIDSWRARKRIPDKYIATLQVKGINPDWLLTGEGEMYKTPNNVQNAIIAQGSNHNIVGNIIGSNVDNELKELCEAFQKLSPKKRKYFYHLIMAEVYKEEE